jgi:hypothetical protein
MDPFMNSQPFTIREHNRLMHAEVDTLRLQTRLRKMRTTAKVLLAVSGSGVRAGNQKSAWLRSTELVAHAGRQRRHLSHGCPARG